MAKDNAVPRRRSYNLRPLPCRRTKMDIPYLPLEIIFSILLFLPAEVLYNVMRYVCKDWYNIIRSPEFIDAHVVRPSRGIILSLVWPQRYVHYLEMGKYGADMTELYPYSSSCMGTILASCNGLLLLSTLGSCNMYVGNPITKEIVALPYISTTFMGSFSTGLAYASRSKKYKVVHFYVYPVERGLCKIFTLNVDSRWRRLGGMQEALIPAELNAASLIYHPPICTEGFVHMTRADIPYTLSLDIETEKFYVSAIPKGLQRKGKEFSSMGGLLCLMDCSSLFSREFWVLTDVQAGEWTKVACVDLQSQQRWLQSGICRTGFELIHLGSLNDGELQIFHVNFCTCRHARQLVKRKGRNCISYNVNTGGIEFIRLDDYAATKGLFYPHVKSLVSPKRT